MSARVYSSSSSAAAAKVAYEEREDRLVKVVSIEGYIFEMLCGSL